MEQSPCFDPDFIVNALTWCLSPQYRLSDALSFCYTDSDGSWKADSHVNPYQPVSIITLFLVLFCLRTEDMG